MKDLRYRRVLSSLVSHQKQTNQTRADGCFQRVATCLLPTSFWICKYLQDASDRQTFIVVIYQYIRLLRKPWFNVQNQVRYPPRMDQSNAVYSSPRIIDKVQKECEQKGSPPSTLNAPAISSYPARQHSRVLILEGRQSYCLLLPR